MPQSFDIWYVKLYITLWYSTKFAQSMVMWSNWPHPGCHRVYIDL